MWEVYFKDEQHKSLTTILKRTGVKERKIHNLKEEDGWDDFSKRTVQQRNIRKLWDGKTPTRHDYLLVQRPSLILTEALPKAQRAQTKY